MTLCSLLLQHEKFQSAPASRVGTPAYLAPEVISNTRGKTYDGKIADIWSAGVMLYVMLAAAYPFERPEDKYDRHKLQKLIQRIMAVKYNIPSRLKLSEECKDLLRRILVADPTKRITIKEIYAHPWFLKDLPAGVIYMNDRVHPPAAGTQTQDEIIAIIREAQIDTKERPDASRGRTDQEIDDSISHYLDEEEDT